MVAQASAVRLSPERPFGFAGSWGPIKGYEMGPSDGPAFVLVHGIGVSGAYFRPLAERLARHYRIVVPDLPGFGGSNGGHRVLSIAEHGEALAELLGARVPGPRLLVGHSMGCQVIAEAMARNSNAASGVVLIGPTIEASARSAPRQALRLLSDALREPLHLDLMIIRDYLRSGVRRYALTVPMMIDHRLELALPQVRVPALVIRGSRDPIVSSGWAGEVAQLLPEGELVEIKGAPHIAHYRYAGEVAGYCLQLAERQWES